eukprot:NODE_3385_length_1360_cov_54.912692_g2948_i0.p1 GENE.NODE_3385_length_1360_cov_54.912692_g2948_i0~~NODE_3385_length_1360_cov_54.912692_g2948_i0.p1  ORF type:complete len:381 (-),score=51.78 NODE_3385_length_1360_cov_54.912692_g2948_i0:218-1306(-)
MIPTIRVSPQEGLFFPPPLDRQIDSVLAICNTSSLSQAITYKIKTTAPSNYVVKPRMGILHHGQEQQIRVTMRPQPKNVDIEAMKKHRFQIEYREVSGQELLHNSNNPEALWNDGVPVIEIHKMKLQCNFSNPTEIQIHDHYVRPPSPQEDYTKEIQQLRTQTAEYRNDLEILKRKLENERAEWQIEKNNFLAERDRLRRELFHTQEDLSKTRHQLEQYNLADSSLSQSTQEQDHHNNDSLNKKPKDDAKVVSNSKKDIKVDKKKKSGRCCCCCTFRCFFILALIAALIVVSYIYVPELLDTYHDQLPPWVHEARHTVSSHFIIVKHEVSRTLEPYLVEFVKFIEPWKVYAIEEYKKLTASS